MAFQPVKAPTKTRPRRKVQIYLDDDPELYRWLVACAAEFGMTKSDVARQALKFAMNAE